MKDDLYEQTIELINIVKKAEQIYREAREEDLHADFQTVVKPFADQVKQLVDKWLTNAEQWVSINRPKYLSSMQLKNTHNNILQVSVHCYFPESSKSRFIKHCKASLFVLEQIQTEKENGK